MNTYHATPYDITASGFYFQSLEEYASKAAAHRNDHGQPVEEYEIQFIDGNVDDCALFSALSVSLATLEAWFDEFEGQYDGIELIKVLFLVSDQGLSMADIYPRRLDDVMVFEGTMRDYAEQYLEDSGIIDAVEKAGLNRFYIDVDAYARDIELEGVAVVNIYANCSYVIIC